MFINQGMRFALNSSDLRNTSYSHGVVFYSGTMPTEEEFKAEFGSYLVADGHTRQKEFNDWAVSKGCTPLGYIDVQPWRKVDLLKIGHNGKRLFSFAENVNDFAHVNDGTATWFAFQTVGGSKLTGVAVLQTLDYCYIGSVGLSSGDRTEDLLIRDNVVTADTKFILNDLTITDL